MYTTPGMNDVMTVWDNSGEKSKLRKYYLILYLRETYQLFKLAKPDVDIGFSKFASLRPVNVLLPNSTFNYVIIINHIAGITAIE